MGLFVKLLIAFSVVALVAGGVGVAAICYIGVLDRNQSMMYDNNTVPLGDAAMLTEMFQRSRVVMRDVILLDDAAAIPDQIDNLQKKFDSADEAYQKILTNARASEVLQALRRRPTSRASSRS